MATELSDSTSTPDAPAKPTLFIGSSSERLKIAYCLQEILSDFVTVTVWKDAPELDLGSPVLQGLIEVGELYDFTLLVFGQDDSIMMRGLNLPTVRENVIFELGLFMGHMGPGRALWLSPRGSKAPQLSSDLEGIVHLEFDEPDPLSPPLILQALAETRDQIYKHITSAGFRNTKYIVPMTRALCLGSSEYSQTRFQGDIKYIHDFFSRDQVESKQGVTADDFENFFSPGKKWDMIHLALYLDKENQRIWLDPVSGAGKKEWLEVQAIDGLIKDSGAQLVVIITCDSLKFGQQLSRFTNVIAGHQAIAPTSALQWAKVFYRALSTGMALSKAFYRAQDVADPGLVFFKYRDVCFRRISGVSVGPST